MKNKTLLTSLMSIALLASISVGATYALFTSESEVNIAVTSGKVSVIANIDEDSVQTKQLYDTDYTDGADNTYKGVVTFSEEGLTLEKFVPGDGTKFNIVVKNESNVTVQYRTIISCENDNGLFAGLNVTVGDKEGYNGVTFVSDWEQLIVDSADAIIPVSIELPEDAGNEYQDKTCTISYKVEAVQGNVQVENPEDGVLYIWNAYDLKNFRNAVNSGTSFFGETVKLAADIDLNNEEWTPIGTWDNTFDGTFDGQGYTISNLYINAPETDEVALFGVATSATIENINVHNVNVAGYNNVATIVAVPYTGCTISNCHVTGSVNIVAEYAYAGGIATYGYIKKIDNCSVIPTGIGTITAKDRNAVGGIMAWALEDTNGVISNCTVKDLELTGWANIGSIAGFVHRTNSIIGCTAENIVITKTRDGGTATLGYVAGGWSCTAAGKTITISNNTIKNVELNGNYVSHNNGDDYLVGINVLIGGPYNGTEDVSKVLVESNNVLENVTDNRYCKISTVAELQSVLNAGLKGALVADIEAIDVSVPAGVTATLDLNGHKIFYTAKESNTRVIHVENTATLTIEDSVGTGKITYHSDNSSYNGYTMWVEGELVLTSGTLEKTGYWAISYAVDVRPSAWGTAYTANTAFTMKGGKIVCDGSAIRVAYDSSSSYSAKSSSFTMNGGTIKATGDGVFVQQTDDTWDVLNVTVNDGTITSSRNPIRIYAPAATGYVGGEDCIKIVLSSNADLEYIGDTDYTDWIIEDVIRYGGGATKEQILADTIIKIDGVNQVLK